MSIPSNSLVDTWPISVLDFNPYNVARFSVEGNRSGDHDTRQPISGRATRRLVKDSSQLIHPGFFAEPVYSSLPYIETISSERYNYPAVLMDEERILGLRVRSSMSCLGFRADAEC